MYLNYSRFPRSWPGLAPYLVEDLLQVGCAHAVSQVAVGWVGEEEFALGSQGGRDVFLAVYVLLAPVHHANVACGTGLRSASLPGRDMWGCGAVLGRGTPTSAQRKQLVLQHIPSICALVHQVQLGDDPNGALAWEVTQEDCHSGPSPHSGDFMHSQAFHTAPLLPCTLTHLAAPLS